MKHSKKCPKCAGSKIIKVEADPSKYRFAPQIAMGISIFSAISMPQYICGTCGYSEIWIDEEDLSRIAEKYPECF